MSDKLSMKSGFIMRDVDYIRAGEVFRHYKGSFYVINFVGFDPKDNAIKYIGYNKVVLENDGNSIKLPMKILSKDDKNYVRAMDEFNQMVVCPETGFNVNRFTFWGTAMSDKKLKDYEAIKRGCTHIEKSTGRYVKIRGEPTLKSVERPPMRAMTPIPDVDVDEYFTAIGGRNEQ